MVRARDENLPDVLRDLKKFTANRIIKEISSSDRESRRDWMLKRFEFSAQRHVRNSVHQFWTHENHPIEITSTKFINQKLNYIHENPVRAGWWKSHRNTSTQALAIMVDVKD